MADAIAISPEGRSWAVKHNGGYLGYAETEDQARMIAQDLVVWLKGQGRSPDLLVADSHAAAPDPADPGTRRSTGGVHAQR